MKENYKIAVEFTEKIKQIKGILQVILFGSVSRGEDTFRSDIDIAIVHERNDAMELRKELNKNLNPKIQLTLLNLKNLPKETELVGALSGEGLLLYGKPFVLQANKLDLIPKILITYSLKSLFQTDKVKIIRALYGSTSKSESKGKTYITQTKGLVSEIGITKINNGVLIADRKKATKIINLFKRFNVDYKEMVVWTY